MDSETIKAIADFAWPILAAAIIFALLPTVKSIARSRAFKIKFGDAELSVEDASQQLRKQLEDLQDQVRKLLDDKPSQAVPPTLTQREPLTATTSPKQILWVDDHPTNNAYEIAKLQQDGYEIETVRSTRDALDYLRSRSQKPDLIISDMARQEGMLHRRTAGLELIREVRGMGLTTPIYIYAAKWRDGDQVRQAGGNGVTTSSIELMRLIEEAGRS